MSLMITSPHAAAETSISCACDLYNSSCTVNINNCTETNITIHCQLKDSDDGGQICLPWPIAIAIVAVMGLTNLMTITLCGAALCCCKRKITSLRHITNRYITSIKSN